MSNKLKIAWICSYSDSDMRSWLNIEMPWCERLLRKITRKANSRYKTDEGMFITLALEEIKKIKDIELHVICLVDYLTKKQCDIKKDNVHYHFIKNEGATIKYKLKKKIGLIGNIEYVENSKLVNCCIENINPQLIHLIGAENNFYSSTILNMSSTRPILVQLLTLLNDSDFLKNYPISKEEYENRANMEMKVFERANYIGTKCDKYVKILTEKIGKNHFIINTSLPLTEPINDKIIKKEYDFVYFAADISKSYDWALEAFAEANKIKPGITLNVIGAYDNSFKIIMDKRALELGVQSQIKFEGRLPSHKDVLNQIRKSHFALLPLKIDLISGTIRESMANGLPVVTTITPGTPNLNLRRESVLLSKPEDFKGMAKNMCKLLENNKFAESIRSNAYITAQERDSNYNIVKHWIEAYQVLIEHYYNNTPIPTNFISNR